ncbi:hypothetical protein PNEG_01869 [Pneumocystis murina B123]|uniref:Uncharacterized protein n=1 Tax=Pneumocystis murina (strain B123) TaxID=1069680 RepID=M7NR01_PNEMU|nr:hypothetical protein PNEG_01869 [Pneumocystis murina B123]EMR09682.1 hypothetical protein PNEG_01869 [Pneumocystis murina B123]
MCFNLLNTHEKPMNNKTKSCMCLPLSCLNEKSCKRKCEVMGLSNEQSDLDSYDCFFGNEMPVYMGKPHGSSKVNDFVLKGSPNIGKKMQKDIEVDRGTLKDIFQINPQYGDRSVGEIIKGLSKNSSSLRTLELNKLFNDPLDNESRYTDLITMNVNPQQILGKDSFNLLNRELGTIPENEVLHCFYTTYYRTDPHI